MQELYDKIYDEMKRFQENAESQIGKGNKAAGVRSRKSSLALAKLLKEWREKSVKGGE